MAKENKVDELQKKSRLDALKILGATEGLPVSPRKAMSQAKKATKARGYPVSPYPKDNPIQLYQLYKWGREEWNKLGKWQPLVTPVMILVALMTWEKERNLQDEYAYRSTKIRARRMAFDLIDGPKPKKRKLLGFIPLPGR